MVNLTVFFNLKGSLFPISLLRKERIILQIGHWSCNKHTKYTVASLGYIRNVTKGLENGAKIIQKIMCKLP